jgi:hypothetical protein
VNVVNSGNFPFSYNWTPSNIILGNSNESSVLVSSPANTYLNVEVTSSNNCVFNDSILIQISPFSIQLEVSNDTILCVSQFFKFSRK